MILRMQPAIRRPGRRSGTALTGVGQAVPVQDRDNTAHGVQVARA